MASNVINMQEILKFLSLRLTLIQLQVYNLIAYGTSL
jgi:hypothetical protein